MKESIERTSSGESEKKLLRKDLLMRLMSVRNASTAGMLTSSIAAEYDRPLGCGVQGSEQELNPVARTPTYRGWPPQ